MALIDRDALIESICGSRCHRNPCSNAYDNVPSCALIKLVECAPKVEAVPVVHGRWIFSGDDDEYMNCSACGNQRYSTDLDHKSDITSYCPHCGARMDGKEQA